jgi:hypothetical protein
MKDRPTTPGPAHEDSASDHPVATSEPLTIRHPWWCTADTDTETVIPGEWCYRAPAEADNVHRDRTFHIEAGDTTYTVALVQPFTVHQGRLMDVSEPAIELAVRDHAVADADSSNWLDASEVELLIKFLQRTVATLRNGHHLPDGVLR